jgi:hypothetical protein
MLLSADAVGSVESRGSDVKVGTSGKYPPPTEPFLSFGEASNGDWDLGSVYRGQGGLDNASKER